MMNGYFFYSKIETKVIQCKSPGSYRLFRIIGLLVFVFFSLVLSQGKSEYTLNAVVIPGPPIIQKNKRIMYGLDLVFDAAPQDYWVYYSKNTKKLVVDFYGIHIKGDPDIDLTGRGVFKDVEVVNKSTNLALSEKRSCVLIGMDPNPEWHFKATVIDERKIRIVAWKDITGLTKIGKKKKTVGLYVIVTTLVSLATFFAIVAINSRFDR